MAKSAGWSFKEGQAGWGSHAAMLSAMVSAVANRAFVLADTFSMADVIFGGTIRYMLGFKMVEPRPLFTAYAERLAARPALQRAEARNAAVRKERGPDRGVTRAIATRTSPREEATVATSITLPRAHPFGARDRGDGV
jgi:hypothetical protein